MGYVAWWRLPSVGVNTSWLCMSSTGLSTVSRYMRSEERQAMGSVNPVDVGTVESVLRLDRLREELRGDVGDQLRIGTSLKSGQVAIRLLSSRASEALPARGS
jgi:hypothetical protein